VQFLGRQWSTDQLNDFARDLLQTTQVHARGLAAWQAIALGLQECAQNMCSHFGEQERQERVDWSAVGDGLQVLMTQAQAALAQAEAALETVAEMAPELHLLRNRAVALADRLTLFMQQVPNDAVRWLEHGRQLRLLQSPLDVSQAMQSRVLPAAAQDGEPRDAAHASNTAWVFTSATLGHDDGLTWMVDSCGLAGARVLKVSSPFDYAQQAALYVPPDFPLPSDPAHSQAVAALALQGALQLGGRTLVLTTTLRAMVSIGQALERSLQAQPDRKLELLLQGKQSKRELLERFMQGGPQHQRGAILVGSATFWEGIDMPGEALQLLLIDKLPFAPPDDPVQQARAKALEAVGKKAFMHLHLPQAAVALRQGAGRLIRRESDRGVLVVCDVRLQHKGYGRKLIAALPPMQRLVSAEEFALALAALGGAD
ncbi:MAG: ATP-dependent DNA helicase, partial [Rhodoferax sp.]|nr:ATP-dependent DNA helicase [Rhodoferax sp.]